MRAVLSGLFALFACSALLFTGLVLAAEPTAAERSPGVGAASAANVSNAPGVVPRYYISLREVEGPSGMAPCDAVLALARQILIEELGKRPEVLLGGAGKAAGTADLPAGGAALTEELARRKLKGYRVTLRLLTLSRTLNPPPPGKPFRVLERNVKLTVVGSTLPGDQLALGGDGESIIQADVGSHISDKQERDLLSDALHDAIGQAIEQAMKKLETSAAPERKRRR